MEENQKTYCVQSALTAILLSSLILVCVGIFNLVLRSSEQAPASGIVESVAQVIPSVVHVLNVDRCEGSGVFVAPGLVVTAKHVVSGGSKFVLTGDDGRKWETADVLVHNDYDIAFIRVSESVDIPSPVMRHFGDVRLGEAVFAIGSPYGFSNFNSVTLGIISARHRECESAYENWGWSVTFQTDAAIHPGNSGGPCFDLDGHMIGIVVAGMGYSGNVSYCIPVDVFENDLDTVLQLFEMLQYGPLPEVTEEVYSYAYSLEAGTAPSGP